MGEHSHDVVVECDETIDRAPATVWEAVLSTGGSVTSEASGDRPQLQPGAAQGSVRSGVEVMRPSPEMFMEQRVVDRQDEVMVLHMKMTRSINMPWSAYESTLRVEPISGDPARSRVALTCLATPTGDAAAVSGMLRGLMLVSLRSLKARVEKT